MGREEGDEEAYSALPEAPHTQRESEEDVKGRGGGLNTTKGGD